MKILKNYKIFADSLNENLSSEIDIDYKKVANSSIGLDLTKVEPLDDSKTIHIGYIDFKYDKDKDSRR